jgi:hypothetical protein
MKEKIIKPSFEILKKESSQFVNSEEKIQFSIREEKNKVDNLNIPKENETKKDDENKELKESKQPFWLSFLRSHSITVVTLVAGALVIGSSIYLGVVYNPEIAAVVTGIGLSLAVVVPQAFWPFVTVSTDNIEASFRETPKLINKAKYELKIVSRTLSPQFYNAEPILQALEESIKRGVEIKILCGPTADFTKVPKLKNWNEQRKIELKKLTEEPSSNFIVVDDGRHIRLEVKDSPEGTRAIIVYNSVELGPKYALLFNKLWWNSRE